MRALVRDPARAAALERAGVALVTGDLGKNSSLGELVRGADAVVHCAGAVRGNSQADFDAVNVAGTAALLEAVDAQAPNARLCLLSSIVAREPDLSWYSRSKHDGERRLTARDDLDWVVLRPPAVYGPGDTEMLPIFRAMARGIATVPGSAGARTSLIHVHDLVQAIVTCLQAEGARGKVLELDDGHNGGYSWAELAAIGAQVLGRRVRLWRVPGPLLDAVAAGNSALARLTGRAPMLTPPKLRELRHPDWVADNRAITAASGWTPTIDFADGLARLVL